MPEPQIAENQPSFEQALSSLETIVHDLEAGRLSLADSLARYEEGIKLLKQCYAQLEQAERKIELLRGSTPPVIQSPSRSTMKRRSTSGEEDQPPRLRLGAGSEDK